MLECGFIKLYRKLVDWEWFHDSHTLHVFIYLLVMAQYQETKFRGITVKRGQLITGRKRIAQDTNISEQSVRTALSNLKSTSNLTIKSTNKYSLITICNYESYQHYEKCDQPADQPASQPTTNHIQEVKNYNNNNIESDWQMLIRETFEQNRDRFLSLRPDLSSQYDLEVEQCVAHNKGLARRTDPKAVCIGWLKNVRMPSQQKQKYTDEELHAEFGGC